MNCLKRTNKQGQVLTLDLIEEANTNKKWRAVQHLENGMKLILYEWDVEDYSKARVYFKLVEFRVTVTDTTN